VTDRPLIRVLVAEDNALMRLGIVTMLRTQPDIDVVGEAPDGARAIALARQLRPDVLLLDLKMPTLDGVQVIANLCGASPEARILVLTHYDAEEDIFRAVRAGARGYLTKDAQGEQIVEAIRTVHAGGRYLPAEIAGRLAERMSQPSLSPRELQVLEHVARGLTNREIARELSLTEKTAGAYVGNVLAKLGASTRTEAVAIGRERGLLPRG
jgi:two-component system NarL family response regulator